MSIRRNLPRNGSFILHSSVLDDVLTHPITKITVWHPRLPNKDQWWAMTVCLVPPGVRGLQYIQVSLALDSATYGRSSAGAGTLSTNVVMRASEDMFSTANPRILFEASINVGNPLFTFCNFYLALHNYVPRYSVSVVHPNVNHDWIREVIAGLVGSRMLNLNAVNNFDGAIVGMFGNTITWPPHPGRIFL